MLVEETVTKSRSEPDHKNSATTCTITKLSHVCRQNLQVIEGFKKISCHIFSEMKSFELVLNRKMMTSLANTL